MLLFVDILTHRVTGLKFLIKEFIVERNYIVNKKKCFGTGYEGRLLVLSDVYIYPFYEERGKLSTFLTPGFQRLRY